ncbi:MAG TPA: crossover junction endodeoxyribonuclease RuvC [Anaerolineales bacterium]|nr:crossover junction endodeoxyribonuclease RuvC [Anaerolineales bacterium]
MLVIGVDPGTATTGYGFVREGPGGDLTGLAYGVIQTPTGLPIAERLALLHGELAVLLERHKPDTAAVEKLFFQKNVTTAISVAQGRGAALVALAQAGLDVAEYTPMEIKQAIAGYGGAGKSQVQQMVRALLNLDDLPRPDDAADALAVAICHLHSRKSRALYDQV